MNGADVGELLALLRSRYPNWLVDVNAWANALAQADAEAMMYAASVWLSRHEVDPPTPAILFQLVRLHEEGVPRVRAAAWEAYKAECARQGREPTSRAFEREIAAEKRPEGPSGSVTDG